MEILLPECSFNTVTPSLCENYTSVNHRSSFFIFNAKYTMLLGGLINNDVYAADAFFTITGYFLASALLVQNWGVFPALQWNILAWTISVELLFYLAFPPVASALLLCSGRPAWLAALGGALFVTLALAGWHSGLLVARINEFGPSRCLLECSLGAWLCVAASRSRIRLRRGILFQAASIGCLALFVFGPVPDYVAVPASALCLLWSLLEPRNAVSRVLSSRIILVLGRLSFATYIVHYPIRDLVKMTLVGSVPQLAATTTYVAAVLLASFAVHYLIERPAQLAVRNWVNGVLRT